MVLLKPNRSNISKRKKKWDSFCTKGEVDSGLPQHFSEFMIFYFSHSNPHYIKIKANLSTCSEFIFL